MDNEDKSWMNSLRWTDEYIRGVNNFLDKAFESASQGNEYYALARSVLISIGILEMWWKIILLMVTPDGYYMQKAFSLELHIVLLILVKVLTCVMILMGYFMIHFEI